MVRFPRSLAVAVVLVACSPAQPAPRIEAPTPLLIADAGTARNFPSPAHWSLLPNPSWTPVAQVPVQDGNLQIGAGGERWIFQIPTGNFVAAPDLAPEPLVGLAQTTSGFRFAGKSGTLYEAPAALAPLVRVGDPVKGARAVALGQKAVLAIDGAGDLVRSADGHDWRKVAVPQHDGVFVDVAMHAATGLLVAAPQRIFFTNDDGLTWKTIPSPGEGVRGVASTDRGVQLEGASSSYALTASSGTFSPAGAQATKRPPSSRAQRSLAMDGKTAVVVETEGETREHKVAVFEVGTQPSPKKIDALDGCIHVTPAIRGKLVMLACDAVGSIQAGINTDKSPLYQLLRTRPAVAPDGGKETGMITKLFRSEDRGKTFEGDQVFDGGQPEGNETSFFLGENGFAYLGARCVSYGARACAGPRVRMGGAWMEMTDDTGRHIAFVSRAGQPAYSVSVDGKTTALYKWAQGAAPEQVAILASRPTPAASLDADDTVVRGFIRAEKPRAFEVRGAAVTDLALPPQALSAAFAGKLGLAVDSHGAGYETTDGGKSWYAVGVPASTSSIAHCDEEGCLTTRGFRAGWEGTGTVQKDVHLASKHAKPLRCRASGSWTALGGGDIPTAEAVDQGPLRWLLPTRDLPGSVTLLTNKWTDAPGQTGKTALAGPAPQPPTHGASTMMHVQPGGVVVVRHSYLRARTGTGAYNPVDMSAVWYRATTGKTFRAALKLPPFRVNKDPRYEHVPTPSTGEWPEIAWLGPRGVHFRASAYPGDEEWTIHHLRDDGKIDRAKVPELHGSEGRVVEIGGQLVVVTTEDEQWGVFGLTDRKEILLGVMGGLSSSEAPVSLFDFGGKPAFLGTLTETAPRAWAIPVAAQPDLAAAVAMPTQASLGDVPKGCDAPLADPKGFRAVLPFVWGSRHPLAVEVDGAKHLLATARSTVHGVAGGDICTAAFEAVEVEPEDAAENELGALVFPSDPSAALLFRANRHDWPDAIAVRPMACTFEAGPLPQELESVAGFKAP